MTLEFPAGSRWLQLKGRAVAITPDERVYLVQNGRAVELVAVTDDELPPPEGLVMPVTTDEEWDMGCDIHIFAEKRRADGSYEPVDIAVADQIGDYKFTRDLLDNRNYSVFAWLAGVRNYSGVTPLSAPRGLPADTSKAIAEEYAQWDCDAHSASWFSLSELLAVDFEQPIEIAPNCWSGGRTADAGEGRQTTLRDFLGNNVERELRLMSERGADRIVFWFDN